MNKIDKDEAAAQIKEAELYTGIVKYHADQLPRTPGRDMVERGLQTVREGLSTIRKEAEL